MAKPLTRAVRRLANRLGYDIERLQKVEFLDGTGTRYWGSGNLDAFGAVATRPVEKFDIVLRCCERVTIHNQAVTRFNGAPKAEIILRCINSLIRSVGHALDNGVATRITFTVIDDHSDADFLVRLRKLLETARCPTEIVPLEDTGVGAALKGAYERARTTADELIYLAEDDYLHAESAVQETVETYARLRAVLGEDVALFPADDPYFYRSIAPCQVMLGSHRHWRSVTSTTGTNVVSAKVLEKNWDTYMAFTRYGVDPEISEATTISKIFANMPCFSPLPSLAAHFQHLETLSPYFDWRRLWDASAPNV